MCEKCPIIAGKCNVTKDICTKKKTRMAGSFFVPDCRLGLGGGLGAEFVEGPGEFLSNALGRVHFNRGTLHQVNKIAIAQNGNCRGSRRVAIEVGASALGCFAVLSREDRN